MVSKLLCCAIGHMNTKILWIAAAILLLGTAAARAQQDLTNLSLQDLLNIEVTTVSFKGQRVSKTAAAVQVITALDIERSGAATLADVLRLVPGFSVAEANASAWSITSRGFGGLYSNKLLVLIDGRSIFSELEGNVPWATHFPPLDMIKQIEVIRGPGASIWGANAVNGVINIVTKPASEQRGGHAATRIGRYEPGTADVSYGGRIGDRTNYVASARYFQRSSPGTIAGFTHGDDAEAFYARTRLDWRAGDIHRLWLTADATRVTQTQIQMEASPTAPYRQATRETFTPTAKSVTFSWAASPSSRVDNTLVAYYSESDRPYPVIGDTQHAFDVNARQRRAVGDRHDIVAGIEYRLTNIALTNSPRMFFSPTHRSVQRGSVYFQDEIQVTDSLTVTPGIKTENDGGNPVAALPSIRTVWNPTRRQTVWGAVSHGLRRPNLFEQAMHYTPAIVPTGGPLPLAIRIDGSSSLDSETLNAFEVGYRAQAGRVALDLTAFDGRYHDLINSEPVQSAPGQVLGIPVIVANFVTTNAYSANVAGTELAATWTPAAHAKFSAGYSFLNVDYHAQPGITNPFGALPGGRPVPSQQWQSQALFTLPGRVDVTAALSHAAAMPPDVKAYTRLDLRAAKAVGRDVNLVIGAQNLFRPLAVEYVDSTGVLSADVRPNAYAEIDWRF